MLKFQKLAVFGTSAVLLLSASRGFHAHAATQTGRIYTSVRQECELNQLSALPNPLSVNFCMYTDPKSQIVSKALKNVVESGKASLPVSGVDVEIDEPGNNELLQRYIISKIPTIVALQGEVPLKSLEPVNFEGNQLEEEIYAWIDTLTREPQAKD